MTDTVVVVKLLGQGDKAMSQTEILDINVLTLSEFENYAAFDTDFEWDRYNFAHLKAEIDRTGGKIQKIIDEKSLIPNERIKPIVENNLGGYINLYYRSLKNFRDGNLLASLMDATESIPFLLTALFAMNGRVKPYNKYLKWELTHFPLKIEIMDSSKFINFIEKIIATGDIEIQKELFKEAKKVFVENGFTEAIDDWNGYYLG